MSYTLCESHSDVIWMRHSRRSDFRSFCTTGGITIISFDSNAMIPRSMVKSPIFMGDCPEGTFCVHDPCRGASKNRCASVCPFLSDNFCHIPIHFLSFHTKSIIDWILNYYVIKYMIYIYIFSVSLRGHPCPAGVI